MIFNLFTLPFIILSILAFFTKKNNSLNIILILSILMFITFLSLLSLNIFNIYSDISLSDAFNFNNKTYSMILILSIIFIFNTLFLLTQNDVNPKLFAFIILYSIFGINLILINNLLNFLIYWELLSITAFLIILLSNFEKTKETAIIYFVIHCISGILLFIGINEYSIGTGSFDLPSEPFNLEYTYNYFILFAILLNLGVPPFSSWLIRAYSQSSHNASLYLSVYTTKVSIFSLLIFFHNNIELIYFGILLGLYGGIMSAFQSNFRKILAYSIIQHLGIMTIAFSNVDLASTTFIVSYIVVDMLYKSIFFIINKILYNRFGTENIFELRSKVNIKSITGFLLIFSSIQTLGLPISGGFIAKTYLSEQIDITWVYYMLTFISSLIALNLGIRLPYTLINFRNTAPSLNINYSYKLAILFIPIFLLQSFYFAHLQFLNLPNILHSLEVLGLSIFMFILVSKVIIKNREERMENMLNMFMESIWKKIALIIKKMLNLNVFGIFEVSYEYFANKFNKQDYTPKYFSAKLVSTSILVFIIIYLLSRVI